MSVSFNHSLLMNTFWRHQDEGWYLVEFKSLDHFADAFVNHQILILGSTISVLVKVIIRTESL